MNKKLTTWLVLAALLAAGGVYWWKRPAPASQPGAGAPAAGPAGARGAAQTVSTVLVQRRDVPVTLEAAGTVVSLNSVDVRPQVSSTVRTVHIKEGQFVKRGDMLFSFDDRADRANVEKARAQVLRDRATLADLERQWKRAQELRAQNFISQSAADTVQAQLEAQQAATRADEAALQASEVALSYANIRSPLAGRAGAISVYPGSLVQPSGAALVTIAQVDPIGVAFTVPEAQLAALMQPARPATAGGVPGPAPQRGGDSRATGAAGPLALLVSLPAPERGRGVPPAEPLRGQLSFIDNAVDTTTGTIRLKGSVPNPQQQLWPGQYVTVRMTLRTLKDALVVPQVALIQRGQERSVYVVGEDRTVQARTVQLRYPFGELAVVDGLQPGERVVVEGKQNLRPGATVREAPAGAARGASAAASSATASSGTASGTAR